MTNRRRLAMAIGVVLAVGGVSVGIAHASDSDGCGSPPPTTVAVQPAEPAAGTRVEAGAPAAQELAGGTLCADAVPGVPAMAS